MEKLIITAAICGAEVTKAQNEAVPYTVVCCFLILIPSRSSKS